MAQVPILKHDEQYPLLNPDGGGDAKKPAQNPTTVVTPEWNVTCAPKQSLCSRWPQFLSACWMSLVLLVISLFVFYALAMSFYRRQPIVILRCNDSKPAGDMYYHYIVPEENAWPFKTFSPYISYMATTYPSLRYQIYFLMDDTTQPSTIYTKKSRLFKRFNPQPVVAHNCLLNQNKLREIQEFQRKYQNVNVSVFCLSTYMARTPLKFVWKTMPFNYLPFYARVYEVWKNGGIGLDLATHNYRFNALKRVDNKLDSILKQHNDGIKLSKYTQELNYLDNQEDTELVKIIFDIFNNMIYQTHSLFGSDLTDIKLLDDNLATIVHRNKRNSIDTNNNSSTGHVEKMNVNHTASNVTVTQIIHEPLRIENNTNTLNTIQSMDKNMNNVNTTTNNLQNSSVNIRVADGRSSMSNYLFSKVHVYDFSGFIDDTSFNEMLKIDSDVHDILRNKDKNTDKNYLTINSDGSFIAVSSRNHPFLAKLMYPFPLCYHKLLTPHVVIRDTFRKHCSRFIFNEAYCDSIKMLYNL